MDTKKLIIQEIEKLKSQTSSDTKNLYLNILHLFYLNNKYLNNQDAVINYELSNLLDKIFENPLMQIKNRNNDKVIINTFMSPRVIR